LTKQHYHKSEFNDDKKNIGGPVVEGHASKFLILHVALKDVIDIVMFFRVL
jgi:hypothetical protein